MQLPWTCSTCGAINYHYGPCACQRTAVSVPLFPSPQFYPVSLPVPQWEGEITVARLDKNGNLTITKEYKPQ